MKRAIPTLLALALVVAACSSDSTDTTEPASAPDTPTTTQAAVTTTAPPVTTTAAAETTTTAAPVGNSVAATSVVGVLQPYNAAGAALFPGGSVEAHWYQWDGLYVVLYRGWDAANGSPMCPGNSISPSANNWTNVSNSPHLGLAEEICIQAPKIAEAPSGAFACGSLLYYLTEIPTTADGALFGTLELLDGAVAGHTSQAAANLANTPEFEPGLTAYDLPPSSVDGGGIVECG